MPTASAARDDILTSEIRMIHTEHRGRYGTPRVQRELAARGFKTSCTRVRRRRIAAGQVVRRRRSFRRTTDSRGTRRGAPNLLERHFITPAPNQAWGGRRDLYPDATWLAVLGRVARYWKLCTMRCARAARCRAASIAPTATTSTRPTTTSRRSLTRAWCQA